MNAGNGTDYMRGGTGADRITLWDDDGARDTIIFRPGDGGRGRGTFDRIEGFDSGEDRIDMTGFGTMSFSGLDFRGNGVASCYYDGTYLRIDADGDRTLDMLVEFAWVDRLVTSDFIFA
jgi:hypothetical protein